MADDPTIFALSSGHGRAGIAVIRISGTEAETALGRLTRGGTVPARQASRRRLVDPALGVVLDDAVVLRFPGPASFTGEDVVELHVHGGLAVVETVLAALGRLDGLRLAEAGEFTRRAFLNGRMDLTQAEGIADLIDAETEEQRRQALRQTEGALGRLYEDWREVLVGGLGHLEATIDFSEEDLPTALADEVRRSLVALAGAIDAHLGDARRGERLRRGVQIALVGPPNAGKSTLLNLLAGRDAAIVSDRPGTTRDVVEVHLDLGGYPVTVADTAGLHDSADEIEKEGMRRAVARAEAADLAVAVLDHRSWPDVPAVLRPVIAGGALVLVNKVDLPGPAASTAVATTATDREGAAVARVSALTGEGIDGFLGVLEDRVAGLAALGEGPAPTRARHRLALEECRASLGRAIDGWDALGAELVAEDLRLAARAIGRITGKVDVEDLLDLIFRDFCIGK